MMNSSSIPLPMLLSPSLEPLMRLHPTRLSVTLNLRPPSRATMFLPPEETVTLRQLVEVYTPQGSAGVFRVTAVDEVPGEGSEVTLQHGVITLADALIPGSGNLLAPPREVLQTLLDCQTAAQRWELGDVEIPASQQLACSYNNSNVLSAILSLLDELPDYRLELDQTRNPWKINVRALSGEDACECRLTRNLTSLTISRDDSDLCTQVYVTGLRNPLRNEDAIRDWGLVNRFVSANRRLGAAALTALGEQYLASHSQPALTVRMDALDLHLATGEPFDSFTLGRVCRVALPERGAVVRQRVVAVEYDDIIITPEIAHVTLATRSDDAADMITGLMANVTMAYRSLVDADGLLELQAERIEMIAESLELYATKEQLAEFSNEVFIRLDAADASIELHARHLDLLDGALSEAGLRIDGLNASITAHASRMDALAGRLSQAELEINGAEGRIGLKALVANLDDDITNLQRDYASLSAQVDAVGESVSAAEVSIDAANARITEWAGRTQVLENDQGKLERRVTQAELDIDGAQAAIRLKADASTVTSISSRVTSAEVTINGLRGEITLKASQSDVDEVRTSNEQLWAWTGAAGETFAIKKQIISYINVSPESITIASSRVNLVGYVTASELKAELATVNQLLAGTTKSSGIWATYIQCDTLTVDHKTPTWKTIKPVTSVSGPLFNYVTLQYKDHSGNNKSQVVLTSVNQAVSTSTTSYELLVY